jgi:prepilin-type N-terminal cleavage/methylation domain-containing protein
MAAMRRQRGFTLVEILIAFCILTFVITFSLVAFLERNKRLQQASETVLSYQALANESEYWRRKDFDSLASTNVFTSDVTILQPLQPYVATATVEPQAGGTKNVTLSIRWKNGQRESKLTIVRANTGSPGGFW